MRAALPLLPLLAALGYLLIQQPGLSLYTVVTGSMEPDIPRGSLAVVEAAPPSLGEAGAYRLEADGRSYVMIHRVVGIEGGRYLFKGDAAEAVETVPAEKVIGRVALVVPYVGYLYMAGLANPLLVALTILLALAPPGRASTLFPLSFGTGVLAYMFPGRGLAATMGPAPLLAYSSALSASLLILERLLERRDGPQQLLSISYMMLAVTNVSSTDLGGALRWLGA